MTYSLEQVVAIVRKRQGSDSLRGFAAKLGVSAAYLSDIYNGRRDPGPTVLSFVGLQKQVSPPRYIKIEDAA